MNLLRMLRFVRINYFSSEFFRKNSSLGHGKNVVISSGTASKAICATERTCEKGQVKKILVPNATRGILMELDNTHKA